MFDIKNKMSPHLLVSTQWQVLTVDASIDEAVIAIQLFHLNLDLLIPPVIVIQFVKLHGFFVAPWDLIAKLILGSTTVL
jgi:hypothetical protein